MATKHPLISDILGREQMVESHISGVLLDMEYWLDKREREQKRMFARKDAMRNILEVEGMEVEKIEVETMAAKLNIRIAEAMEGKAVGRKRMEIKLGEMLNQYKPSAEFVHSEEISRIMKETTDHKTTLARFYILLDNYKKDIWEYNKEISLFNEERRECQSLCAIVAKLQGKVFMHNKRAKDLSNWAKLLKIAEEDLERKARKEIVLVLELGHN